MQTILKISKVLLKNNCLSTACICTADLHKLFSSGNNLIAFMKLQQCHDQQVATCSTFGAFLVAGSNIENVKY